ncbi:MAG: hypothetical protein WBB57_06055, partial [Mycobacterium sp.]
MQRPSVEMVLGQLGGSGDDHRGGRQSWFTSLAYHERIRQGSIRVGANASGRRSSLWMTTKDSAVTMHTVR